MSGDSPQDITLHCIPVFIPTSDCQPIGSFAEIRESMSAYFEFRLIDSRIPMCGPFEDPELCSIGSVGAVNIKRKSDFSSASRLCMSIND